MQLTCPNCGARYRIDAIDWPTKPGPDDEPVFRPRRARCKVCRSVWAATPEEVVLEMKDPLPPDEEHPRLADAAWASGGGWPDPKPLAPPLPQPDFNPPLDRPPPVFTLPGFTPPKDPSSPLFAPPARPTIHFEAPPVPIPMPERPGALAQVPTEETEAGRDTFADATAPAPAPDIPDIDDEDEVPRRRWPILVGLLALVAVVWTLLVVTGRVAPEEYGLPRYNPAAIGISGVWAPTVSLPRTPPSPLAVEAEAMRRALPGNRQVWEIAGTITNPTAKAQPVPPVELRLLDARGGEVARWTVRPEAESVAPGKAVRFETSAIDPPARAVRLRMQLKPAELGRL